MNKKITVKNISSFFQAYARVFKDLFDALPEHTVEQITFRHGKCSDDCFKEGKCKYCGCDPYAKAFADESCNDGERFPDLMSKEDWEQYKKGLDEY